MEKLDGAFGKEGSGYERNDAKERLAAAKTATLPRATPKGKLGTSMTQHTERSAEYMDLRNAGNKCVTNGDCCSGSRCRGSILETRLCRRFWCK